MIPPTYLLSRYLLTPPPVTVPGQVQDLIGAVIPVVATALAVTPRGLDRERARAVVVPYACGPRDRAGEDR